MDNVVVVAVCAALVTFQYGGMKWLTRLFFWTPVTLCALGSVAILFA